MSRQEKRLQQIERSALREAQKAQRRHPEQSVTREELLSKKVQVLTKADRIALFVVAVLAVGGGVLLLRADYSPIASWALIIFGTAVFVFSVVGWRRTLKEIAGAIGEGAVDILIRAVIKSLDGL